MAREGYLEPCKGKDMITKKAEGNFSILRNSHFWLGENNDPWPPCRGIRFGVFGASNLQPTQSTLHTEAPWPCSAKQGPGVRWCETELFPFQKSHVVIVLAAPSQATGVTVSHINLCTLSYLCVPVPCADWELRPQALLLMVPLQQLKDFLMHVH